MDAMWQLYSAVVEKEVNAKHWKQWLYVGSWGFVTEIWLTLRRVFALRLSEKSQVALNPLSFVKECDHS